MHENVGFMGYNALAGGVLTGKYLVGASPSQTFIEPPFLQSDGIP